MILGVVVIHVVRAPPEPSYENPGKHNVETDGANVNSKACQSLALLEHNMADQAAYQNADGGATVPYKNVQCVFFLSNRVLAHKNDPPIMKKGMLVLAWHCSLVLSN